MSFKSIAVLIDTGPSAATALRYAVKLARRKNAHLLGVFVTPSSWHRNPSATFVRGRAAIQEMMVRYENEERQALELAKNVFTRAAAAEEITAEFRIIDHAEASEAVMLNSLHADLVIIGHPAPAGLPEGLSAELLLLATGVPIMIVPDKWDADKIGTNILIGWNASREARRAIADARPLLADAQSVSVAVVDPARNERHGEEPGADVALYLTRHGAKVTVEHITSNGTSPANALLKHAREHGNDLLVIGAYSHSRTGQRVFGGVTQSLVKNVSMPTLIAH
jgi:nucleotide-binding universal stress UspA family protein